jgi:hypothetical protein
LSGPVPRPRAHVRSSAGPPPAPSLVRARCAPSSTPMSERRPEACLPARTAPGSSEPGSRHRTLRCRPCCRSQTDHSTTLSQTPEHVAKLTSQIWSWSSLFNRMLITVPTMVNIRLRVCASVRSEVPELQHFPNVMDPDTKQHGIPFAEATALLYRLKSPPRMLD